MKVRFSKPALAELDAIFAYIHQRNPVAAGQVVARVREITSQLGHFPNMGHPKYKPGVRMITVRHYPYLIFYTVENNEVLILSVRHGAKGLVKTKHLAVLCANCHRMIHQTAPMLSVEQFRNKYVKEQF